MIRNICDDTDIALRRSVIPGLTRNPESYLTQRRGDAGGSIKIFKFKIDARSASPYLILNLNPDDFIIEIIPDVFFIMKKHQGFSFSSSSFCLLNPEFFLFSSTSALTSTFSVSPAPGT